MDLSYLELEEEGQGIIMKVTRPLLLGQFYLVKWPVNPNILAASVLLAPSKKIYLSVSLSMYPNILECLDTNE